MSKWARRQAKRERNRAKHERRNNRRHVALVEEQQARRRLGVEKKGLWWLKELSDGDTSTTR